MIVKVLNYPMILRYADDTMLGTPASMLMCRIAIQRHPDRLEEWANGTIKNSVKANPALVWKPLPAMTQPGTSWAGATL